MDRAETQELGLFEPRDRAEHAPLFPYAEARLEPHEIPHLPRPVLPTKLYDRVRARSGPRVGESEGPHRAEAESLRSTGGQHLHGEAPLEVGDAVPLVARIVDIRVREPIDEALVLGP